MSYSIAQIIRRLIAPRHKLSCSWFLWQRLTHDLRQRGLNETRESGAFFLGRVDADGAARIVDYVLYDDLDPHSLDSGIVRFDGRYFAKLWSICRARNLTVIADVHVHPGSAGQSHSDRTHPMISQAGHLAMILPNFARAPLPREEIGLYRYAGDMRWSNVPRAERRDFFHIGL